MSSIRKLERKRDITYDQWKKMMFRLYIRQMVKPKNQWERRHLWHLAMQGVLLHVKPHFCKIDLERTAIRKEKNISFTNGEGERRWITAKQ